MATLRMTIHSLRLLLRQCVKLKGIHIIMTCIQSPFLKIRFPILALLTLPFLLLTSTHLVQSAPTSGSIHRVAKTGADVGGCGSLAQPCLTLQEAVNNASSGDTILVAAGTYTYRAADGTCLDGNNVSVVCVLSTHLTMLGGYTTSNWITADPTANVTIIDGQNSYRGVQLHGTTAASASLHIEGFTIQNGYKKGATSGGDGLTFAFGAGMLADRGSVLAKNLIFKNNQAIGGNTGSAHGGAAAGAGLAVRANTSGVILNNITFEGNQATGGTGPERGGFAIGGGFYSFSAVVSGDNLTFTNNVAQAGSSSGSGISSNNRSDAQGAGAAFQVDSNVTLTDVTATGNQAIGGDAPNGDAGGAFGGGIFAELADVTITGLTLSNNLAEGGDGKNPNNGSSLGDGGGIASTRSNVTLSQATIVNNVASGGDGTTFGGAAGGGGVYFADFTQSTKLTLTNVIIADNLVEIGDTGTPTGGGGGGIFINFGEVELNHVTLAQNHLSTSTQGSALIVLNGGDVTIANGILADHTDFGENAIHAQSGNTVTLNNNLFDGNTVNSGGGGTISGSGSNLAGDPDFVATGSPNYNYHIKSGSAAIDQASGSVTAVDIDNQSRAFFGTADVGADEYAPIILNVLPGDQTLTLSWVTDSDLVTGLDHYEIVVSQGGGANPPAEGPSPIDAGTSTSFTLTGLTNDETYTISINARNGSSGLIAASNTVTPFPTDDILYLPIMVRN